MTESDTKLFEMSADVDVDASGFATAISNMQTQMAAMGTQLEGVISSLQSLVAIAATSILTTTGDAVNGLQKLSIADAIATAQGDLSKLDDYTVSLIATAQGATEQAEETSEAVEKIDEAAEKGASGFDKMGASAKQTWKALKQVATDLWEIGVALVAVAADVDSEKRRFNMAFRGIEEEATAALESVSEKTGVHASRMRLSFAEIQTQMLGAGYEGEEALAMTTRAMSLAADAAALYGMDIDEATGRVLSFMRGNLEAGEAIGLFTSAAARDEYVESLYGQKWKELTELQRQAALLELMESRYGELGYAGSAAEFSDSYLNAYANIQAAWRDVRAGLGEPLMKAVAPVLQTFSDWITESPEVVAGLAEAVGLFFTEIANALKSFFTELSNNPTLLSDFVTTMKEFFSGLSDLLVLVKPFADWLMQFLGITPSDAAVDAANAASILTGEEVTPEQITGAYSEIPRLVTDMLAAADRFYDLDYSDDATDTEINAAYNEYNRLWRDLLATMTTDQQEAMEAWMESSGIRDADSMWRTNEDEMFPEGTVESLPPFVMSLLEQMMSSIGGIPSALSGVKVEMDGETVGHLVAPTVLGVMARNARDSRFSGGTAMG